MFLLKPFRKNVSILNLALSMTAARKYTRMACGEAIELQHRRQFRKNTTTMKLKFIPIAFLGAALVACGGGGGGGGGGNSNAATSTLTVTAKVNGVVVAGYPVTAASAPAITLTSGQELEVTSSIPTVFGGNLGSAVAAVRTNSSTTYKAVLASATDTNATLTFTTTALPLQTATIPVTVKATQFQAVVPKVGDSFVYAENDILLNKNTFRVDNTTQRVTAVNGDGTWTETYLTSANAVIGAATYTNQGNRTSFRNDASSTQTCNRQGNKVARYLPEEKLLAFPLTIGSTFTGKWQAVCGTDTTIVDSQDESISARVVGYESVTTAAGVFNAMRIDETTTVANSTNAAFPGGGYTQTVSVWFDPVLGRNVKFSGVRTYIGTPNAVQSASLVETTNIELISYVKN
ncbi:hypothetical protein [Noviherbaspirillum suwonense]|uniref:hypothetical protein n=1 Tax=Noviherbaspirillum suwonense TaxID=1224511 RepID=UPI0024B7DE74|nr:hypothetical protein [Noviherbaspirillum suwonense]